MNSQLNSLPEKKYQIFWKFFISNIFSTLKSFISNIIFDFKVYEVQSSKCLRYLPNKHRLAPHLYKGVPLISMKSMALKNV